MLIPRMADSDGAPSAMERSGSIGRAPNGGRFMTRGRRGGEAVANADDLAALIALGEGFTNRVRAGRHIQPRTGDLRVRECNGGCDSDRSHRPRRDRGSW